MRQIARFSTVLKKSIQTSKTLWKPLIAGSILLIVLALLLQFGMMFVLGVSTALHGLAFAAIAILFSVLGLVFYVYYLVLAVEQDDSMVQTFQSVQKWALRSIGVFFWIFLRSFAWLMHIGVLVIMFGQYGGSSALSGLGTLVFFAGTLCAVSLGPRLLFAQFILVRDGKGIRESIRLSLEQTKGYWGKIVWYCVLLMLLLLAVSISVMLLFSILMSSGIAALLFLPGDGVAVILKLLGIVMGFGILVLFILAHCFFSFLPQVFLVHLWEEIKKHPK